MESTEFVVPDFLEHQSADEIHAQMLENLPADIDKSEGGHPFNLTYPTAYEKALMAEYIMPESIRLIFPQFSYGVYLDYHAAVFGMERRAAMPSHGELVVTGINGTVVPAGSVFATEQVDELPSVEFTNDEEFIIPENGGITVPITSVLAGADNNVPANTILFKPENVEGIESVTNPNPTVNGTDEEDDDNLRDRIMEYCQSSETSFIGNVADYRRWAMSVSGVGNANIIPANDDTGLVKIIITDTNGDPASKETCEAVHNYIMRPDNPLERLAPINANIEVSSPSVTTISISATIELTATASLEDVKKDILASLKRYIASATEDAEIKYTRIGSILSQSSGVNDYSDLLVEGETKNIAMLDGSIFTVSEESLDLTSGQVGEALDMDD